MTAIMSREIREFHSTAIIYEMTMDYYSCGMLSFHIVIRIIAFENKELIYFVLVKIPSWCFA